MKEECGNDDLNGLSPPVKLYWVVVLNKSTCTQQHILYVQKCLHVIQAFIDFSETELHEQWLY